MFSLSPLAHSFLVHFPPTCAHTKHKTNLIDPIFFDPIRINSELGAMVSSARQFTVLLQEQRPVLGAARCHRAGEVRASRPEQESRARRLCVLHRYVRKMEIRLHEIDVLALKRSDCPPERRFNPTNIHKLVHIGPHPQSSTIT